MTVLEYTSPTEGNVILERGSFVRRRACIIPSSVLGFLSYHCYVNLCLHDQLLNSYRPR